MKPECLVLRLSKIDLSKTSDNITMPTRKGWVRRHIYFFGNRPRPFWCAYFFICIGL